MSSQPVILENASWQTGILPGTGASIAFGRVKRGSEWVDVLRPTDESDYDNSSNCSSFIMLPWCNRIKSGLLNFHGKVYPMRTTKDDGTARHGDVRGRAWHVDANSSTHIRMSIRSADVENMNWPFQFSAWAEYKLEGNDFIWTLALKNEDTQPMPGGFGHHPYFVRPVDAPAPEVQIPCDQYFELTNYMATGGPVPISDRVDFRQMRTLTADELNDLLTGREGNQPTLIRYADKGIELAMQADDTFEHILIFAPARKPYFAVEPMSNASDGFNLFENGMPGSGVFVLEPGEERVATVRWSVRV